MSDDILADGYSMIPRAVLLDARLQAIDVRLYGLLAWHSNVAASDRGGDEAWPGQARLQADLGVCERTVRDAMGRLVAAGWVNVIRRGLGKTNEYVLRGYRPAGRRLSKRQQGAGLTGNVAPVKAADERRSDRQSGADPSKNQSKENQSEINQSKEKKNTPPPPVPGGARPPTVPLDGVMEQEAVPVVFDAEPIHDDLDIPPLDAKPPPRNGAGLAAQVDAVYQHWRSYHPTAAPLLRPKAKERRLIEEALRSGLDVDACRRAVDGYHRSPWHCGVNDRGTKYLSLALIFRDAGHVEAGIAMADDPLLGRGMSERERRGVHATQAWLARTGGDAAAPADPWRTPE